MLAFLRSLGKYVHQPKLPSLDFLIHDTTLSSSMFVAGFSVIVLGLSWHRLLLVSESCLQTEQLRSQRSFWMDLMWETGSMRFKSSTVTSGIHCMQAQWHHSPGSVVRFRAPPVTGHRQHCGLSLPSSCKTLILNLTQA